MRDIGTGRRRGQFARGIMVCLWAAGFALLGNAANPAQAQETRTISFHNMHTKEDLTVTYKKNGRYVPEAMARINHMLRDWRRNETTKMSPKLVDLIYDVHRDTGSRQPIHVVSGYRSPVTNASLRSRSNGVAKNSQHMRGNATDLYFPDVALSKIREVGLKYQRGGVGYYPTSGRPFVHLDVGSVRHWPRMPRQQLAKLFPDGNTLHIPSDGKPLGRSVRTAPILVASASSDDEENVEIASASPVRRNDPSAPVFGSSGSSITLASAAPIRPDRTRNVILNKPAPEAPNLLDTAAIPVALPGEAPLPPSRPVMMAKLSQDPERFAIDLPKGNAPVPAARPSPQYSLAGLIASLPTNAPVDSLASLAYAPVSQAAKKGDSLYARAAASGGNPLITAALGPSGLPQPSDLQAEFDDEEEEDIGLTYDAARMRSLMSSRRIVGSAFAILQAPDQVNIDGLLGRPATVVAARFGHGPGQEPMASLFTGPAIKPLLITRHQRTRIQTASAQ